MYENANPGQSGYGTWNEEDASSGSYSSSSTSSSSDSGSGSDGYGWTTGWGGGYTPQTPSAPSTPSTPSAPSAPNSPSSPGNPSGPSSPANGPGGGDQAGNDAPEVASEDGAPADGDVPTGAPGTDGPAADDPNFISDDQVTTDNVGKFLDQEFLDGPGGYCLAGAIINQYFEPGDSIDADAARDIIEKAQEKDENGNSVLDANGFVNSSDELLDIASEVLGEEPKHETQPRTDSGTLAAALGGNGKSDLGMDNISEILDAVENDILGGDTSNVDGLIIGLEKDGNTHFVSVDDLSNPVIEDPHSGPDRSDWDITSIRYVGD